MRIIPTIMLASLLTAGAFAADKPDKVERADWGAISRQKAEGKVILAVDTMPKDRLIPLPTPFDSIISAYIDVPGRIGPAPKGKRVDIQFNADASQIALQAPSDAGSAAIVILETAEKSAQLPDGRIIFSALDAKVTGSSAKLESHPGSHRIGFWSNLDDVVSWEHNAQRPGMYQVELTYSLAGGTSTVAVAVGETTLVAELPPTGSWYHYSTVVLDKVYVKTAGKHAVTAKGTKKEGAAVMNLKAVQLRPAGEGQPVKQDDGGTILLHSRDATSLGTKVQYEHNPVKNTLGYWVNVTDQACWTFTVTKPGTFDVEILQGCGKGSGGAEVAMSLLETTGFGKDQTLKFIVEDTGHFQNFVPRNIGSIKIEKAGEYTFLVKPLKKPGVAVMDLRQVTLKPK
jgi:hypothetical protein